MEYAKVLFHILQMAALQQARIGAFGKALGKPLFLKRNNLRQGIFLRNYLQGSSISLSQADLRARGIGWPTEIPEFDPPYDFSEKEICQLLPGTADGFPEEEWRILWEIGPDPPSLEQFDSDNFQESIDPPHPEE